MPPAYVAILRLKDGTDPKAIADQTEWIQKLVTMKKVAGKEFPTGSKVEVYRCAPVYNPGG